MDDLMREFLAEAAESLAILDVELVKFEQCPNDADILMNIFRVMHTIKGTCGFLGLARLEKVAHAGEDVLGKFRDGALAVTPDAVSVILQCIDRIRDILAAIEAAGEEGSTDDGPLIAVLKAIAEGRAASPPPPSADAPVISDQGFPVAAELLAEVEAALAERAETVALSAAPEPAPQPEPQPVPQAAPEPTLASAPEPVAPAAAARPVPAAEAREPRTSAAQQSIRVSVEVLENLMTLVSELVLTRNNLLQMVRGQSDSEFAEPLQRLSLITTDLQEGVMKTRMQPIGNAWGKLPRIIRDLAVDTGKHLDLQMIGAETEVDRQILELIKDPLTHMVRNSADHGIEVPHLRLAAGKPEVGTVTLRAFHQGGHIIIEIADDGHGLDTDRIRRKAVASGLASEAELDAMSEDRIHQFIMRAGFSTAEKVTSVSGRGVGMDVVRTNIEKIGGTIELKSVAGRGTTFTIKIPLTLAIVSALIVACGEERFAIPQLNVRELVHVSPHGGQGVELVNKTPLLRLRDRLLPLVIMHDLLRLDERRRLTEDSYFVVVTQVGTQTFGIVVDQVFDTEEIVVKPVSRMLRRIPFYSGNTILGDGSVIMILDPNGIATEVGQDAGSAESDRQTALHRGDSGTELILFRAGPGAPKAVPMGLLARLENLETSAIETVGGRLFVQYRGKLMPLISVSGEIGGGTHCSVLVFAGRDRSVGLIVDEVIDIVSEHLKIAFPAEAPGSLGTAVIGGKATDILDAAFYVTQVYADWFDGERLAADAGPRLLLLDSSAASVNTLAPHLAAAGFSLATVLNAEQAMQMLVAGGRFDAVACDLQIAGGEGLRLAAMLRADERWRRLPLVGLAEDPAPSQIADARAAGFADVIAKTEPPALLALLKQLLPAGDAAYREAA